MKKNLELLVLLLILLLLISCSYSNDEKVIVYTSVDRVYSEVIFNDFEKETGIKVLPVYDVEASKTTGIAQRLITEKEHPIGDVFWNGEIIYTLKLKDEGILDKYIPKNFIDLDNMWTAFGGRARIFIINKSLVKKKNYPSSYKDIVKMSKDYNIGLANPVFGTTATHVAAIYEVLGKDKAYNLFSEISENNIRIAVGNGAVRDLVVSGELDFGITDTDDALAALKNNANIDIVFLDQENELGTLIVPNSVSLINNGPNSENGKLFIDYLLKEKTIKKMIAIGWIQIHVSNKTITSNELNPFLPDKKLKIIDIDFLDIKENLNDSSKDMKELFLR